MEVINKNAGRIRVLDRKNTRKLYEHQLEAQEKLNIIDKKSRFSTLLVLPTGAGKTFTSVDWLLKSAINKNKKVLWIAHRHLLLEQACESFQTSANSDILPNRSNFKYRLISGRHDSLIHLEGDEDVLIASKDSLVRNLHLLEDWIEDGIYFVIDEAHHATARTYRKITEYLQDRVKNLRILGLTATPYRTDEKEEALLGQIFVDDIVHGVDLKTLINRSILSKPIFEEAKTELLVGEHLGLNALKKIERQDEIPRDIAEEIARNAERNTVIVNRYVQKKDEYGKTIVFALNKIHAIALKKLFSLQGIKSEFIISGTSTEFTGIDVSNKINEENMERYRRGELDVLINVNILTEGADFPDTKTIFLTRPTNSKTLMTQMIGRGLRGLKSGGTDEAYIVSFIDDWNDKIAWLNPETILLDGPDLEEDTKSSAPTKDIRYISIRKIEEFAKLLDQSIDSSHLRDLDYIERVPLGMYNFTYLENQMDINCQILIYTSTKPYYDRLIGDLDIIFRDLDIQVENLAGDRLENLIGAIEETYFDEYMVPEYNKRDIEDLVKYYAEKGIAPSFYKLDDIVREELNVSRIGQEIYEKDMGPRAIKEYLDSIWNDEKGLIKIYFSRFTYFKDAVMTEVDKLTGIYHEYKNNEIMVDYANRSIEELNLWEMEKHYPEKARGIRNLIFERNKLSNGNYICVDCAYEGNNRGRFHIDHIKPLAKGGLTREENLQIMCRPCNMRKSDKYGN